MIMDDLNDDREAWIKEYILRFAKKRGVQWAKGPCPACGCPTKWLAIGKVDLPERGTLDTYAGSCGCVFIVRDMGTVFDLFVSQRTARLVG